MITLKTPTKDIPIPMHQLRATKTVGEYVQGTLYENMVVQYMSDKLRVMVYYSASGSNTPSYYYCFPSMDEVHSTFDEVN